MQAISPQQVVMAKGRFMEIRRPALLQHLESCLSPSADGHVTAARMKKLVRDFGERVSTRELGRCLELLGASKSSPRLGNPPKVTRVWSGVEESVDDDEDDRSPPEAGAAAGDSGPRRLSRSRNSPFMASHTRRDTTAGLVPGHCRRRSPRGSPRSKISGPGWSWPSGRWSVRCAGSRRR